MCFSKIITTFFLLFAINTAFSQTITVTSKDDSGPGTLRAALESIPINNSTNRYTINFNLPGTATDANRAIRLRSALPSVPSNVVIDGTSQNWPALGVSGAKIILEPEFANANFSGLTIGHFTDNQAKTQGVEIYGLYIRNFAKITNLQNVDLSQGSGILIDYNANNIKIGAVGKGNVISGNIHGIRIQNSYFYNETQASSIVIQSNIIGLIYDGLTANSNINGVYADLYDCSLTVGGDNTGDGNVIAANQCNVNVNRNYNFSTGRFEVNIVNNNIGTDYTGKLDFHELPLFLSSSSLEIYGVRVNAVASNLYMRKNIISGNRTWAVSILNTDFVLTGNAIGTGVQRTEQLGNGGGIKVEAGASGIIGGATPADVNTIAYNNYGIESTSARPVKITQNSMFCNKVFGIGKAFNIFQPFVQILKKRSNYVSGKATPNSDVELFYTQNCEGNCEGKTYFKTVQAGSDGRWEYSGNITASVTATASLLNATTSPFSTTALLPDEAIIEPVTCRGNGSIKIPEPREGMTFTWNKIVNDTRIPLGNAQQITGLEVGTYEVKIDDGCKETAQIFEVTDQTLTVPQVAVPSPGCGELVFQFSATVFRGKGNMRFDWINRAGDIVSTGPQVTLPEGEYKVKVTDEAGCTQESDFVRVVRRPQPKIETDQIVITDAACGLNNGAVKGLDISDETGTLSYKWFAYDYQNSRTTVQVGTALDLENVEGGWYYLQVTDQGSCSPVSQLFFIQTYNSVIINPGYITGTTCGLDNGSINNVSITEANTYELTDGIGNSVKKGAYSQGMLLSFTDLAPGTYTLTATNTISLCANNINFIINQIPPSIYSFTPSVNNTTCGLINGSILLNFSNTSPIPQKSEWRDASGTLRNGTYTALTDIEAGIYTLTIYDQYNCAQVFTYTIAVTPKLAIVGGSGTVANDGCTLKRASITGIQVVGGIPDYAFTWLDANDKAVQYTKDLINVGAGVYRLEVRDKTTCGYEISEAYTVEDHPFPLLNPVMNDIRVCYAQEIMLAVIAPEEGLYQLYRTTDDPIPFLEANNGIFIFNAAKSADYFVRRKLGSCISEFTKVHVEVTNDNLEVMNTFTPNGDGMNDSWTINGLPDYADINIQLYTRSGQLVYESTGKYLKPFDGRFRGKDLPAGVYYFKIDLRADCKPLGGSLTLLR